MILQFRPKSPTCKVVFCDLDGNIILEESREVKSVKTGDYLIDKGINYQVKNVTRCEKTVYINLEVIGTWE